MATYDDSNPFADPFSDPSITKVTTTSKTSVLKNYNPFESEEKLSNMSKADRPAVLPTSQTSSHSAPFNPPPYTPNPNQHISQADLQRRQEELEKKAAELAAREEALKNANYDVKENNWPPIPKFCPCSPCFYLDINVEIPSEFQNIVRKVYYLWMFYIGVLLINMLGALAIFIKTGEGETFGISFILLVFFSPLSFICWFRPLYNAFKKDSSFNFMVFFFVFFCHLVFSVFWAIGVPSIGSCGLIIAIKHTKDGNLLSIFLFLITIILIIYSIFSLMILIKVHNIYRSTGGSFAKAQAEFTSGVLSNEHVQQVATAAAVSAARQAMNQNNSGSGLRY